MPPVTTAATPKSDQKYCRSQIGQKWPDAGPAVAGAKIQYIPISYHDEIMKYRKLTSE